MRRGKATIMRVLGVGQLPDPLTLLLSRLEEACNGGEPVLDEELRTFMRMEQGLPLTVLAVLREYLAREEEAERPEEHY
jgi:hypothetical protein